jgi:hypothetical protein
MRIRIPETGVTNITYRADNHFDKAFIENIRTVVDRDDVIPDARRLGMLDVELGYADYLSVLEYPYAMYRRSDIRLNLRDIVTHTGGIISLENYHMKVRTDVLFMEDTTGYEPLDDMDAAFFMIMRFYHIVQDYGEHKSMVDHIQGVLLAAERLDKIDLLVEKMP